jgi:hypothetical protein
MVYSLFIGDVKELVWNYVGLGYAQVPKAKSRLIENDPTY